MFGYTTERKLERSLIKQYQQDLKKVALQYSPETRPLVLEWATLPLSIKGFGPVKMKNYEAAQKKRDKLLNDIDSLVSGLTQAAE